MRAAQQPADEYKAKLDYFKEYDGMFGQPDGRIDLKEIGAIITNRFGYTYTLEFLTTLASMVLRWKGPATSDGNGMYPLDFPVCCTIAFASALFPSHFLWLGLAISCDDEHLERARLLFC